MCFRIRLASVEDDEYGTNARDFQPKYLVEKKCLEEINSQESKTI